MSKIVKIGPTKQYVAYGEIGHFFVSCDFPR